MAKYEKAIQVLEDILEHEEASLDDDPVDKIVELILVEARRRKGDDPVARIFSVQMDISEKITEIRDRMRITLFSDEAIKS